MDKCFAYYPPCFTFNPMSSRKFIKTKYRGVYYRESTASKHKGKPDRMYYFWFKDPTTGKGRWSKVGNASEGCSAAYANQKKEQFLTEMNLGNRPVPPGKLTTGDAAKLYFKWAEAEGKHVKRERDRWRLHMGPVFDAMPVKSITTGILSQHKANLLDKLSEQSAYHCLSLLRRIINHAIAENQFPGPNPACSTRTSSFRIPVPDNKSMRYLTADEARALLDAIKPRSQQTHDMSLLSLKTGMRATEIFTIRTGDIDAGAGLIHFNAKGGKHQHVDAPADVIEMLLGYEREPGAHIFQATGGGPITQGISGTFGRCVEQLGLNANATRNADRVRFHVWRHTFASWIAQSGKVTLHELKELMRHEKIEMTLRYAHLIPGHKKERLSIIDDVLDPS